MPASCDFSRMQQVHIFLAFMTSILSLSSGVPSLNALHRNDARRGRAYPQQCACVENSKTTSKTPPNQNLKSKEQKTLRFIEAKAKTLSFGLWRQDFFFFLRKQKLVFKTQAMVSVKLAWKQLILTWKQDTDPLNMLCLTSSSLENFSHTGWRFWRVL